MARPSKIHFLVHFLYLLYFCMEDIITNDKNYN